MWWTSLESQAMASASGRARVGYFGARIALGWVVFGLCWQEFPGQGDEILEWEALESCHVVRVGEREEARIDGFFAAKSRRNGWPVYRTQSRRIDFPVVPGFSVVFTRLVGDGGDPGRYPSRATISRETGTIYLVENPLERAFPRILERFSRVRSDPDAAEVYERRQFPEFVGIDPLDSGAVARFRRNYYGIPGQTKGLLASILLEERQHIEDARRGGFSLRQMEERALLVRMFQGLPFLEMAEAHRVRTNVRFCRHVPAITKFWSNYKGLADFIEFAEANMSTGIWDVTEAELRCLAEQYLFDHYADDAERLIDRPGP